MTNSFGFREPNNSNEFGDSFGALTSLFSFLAFIGVVWTIQIQRKELKLQRKEMKLQREEMKKSSNEFIVNKYTNIIYNQINMYKMELEKFQSKPDDIEFNNSIFENRLSYYRSLISIGNNNNDEFKIINKVSLDINFEKLRRHRLIYFDLLNIYVKFIKTIHRLLNISNLQNEEKHILIEIIKYNINDDLEYIVKCLIWSLEQTNLENELIFNQFLKLLEDNKNVLNKYL